MDAPPRTTPSTRVPTAHAEDLFAGPLRAVIDLRSPSEFAEDHVPGAVNVPLFDDASRAIVGFLYVQKSPDEAFERGRELALERVHGLVAEVAAVAGWSAPRADLAARVRALTGGGLERMDAALCNVPVQTLGPDALVLHCWRGGMRSRSVIALLRSLGLDTAHGLEGGYKAYRRFVQDSLEGWQAPPSFVLRGLTGVGKTLVLRELEALRPGWTLDLEGCAGHRSSLLGMVGLEPVSQKTFESRLATRLRAGFPGPVVFEGESRKVGDAIVPERLWQSLTRGTNILLTADPERRIDVLIEDYLARPEARPALRRQLAAVEERMRQRAPLCALFDAGDERQVVRLLLEHYYDPLYRHSEKGKAYALRVDAGDPLRAAREVAQWIEGAGGAASET